MKHNYKFFLFALSLAFLFQNCDIKEPTAPSWDVSLNVPIAKKEYTLYDIIEKKSDLIKHYPDGTSKNILYYSDYKKIDKISVDKNLKLNGISSESSESIGPITVATDSIRANIDFSWISPLIKPGMQTQIPPVSNVQAPGDFSIPAQFQTVKVESGKLDLTFTNYFPSPVSITINQLTLKNFGTGETITTYAHSVIIPPKQKVTVSNLELTKGIVIKNRIVMECVVSTTGSNGQVVTLPANSLSILAMLKDLNVSEATAKIAEQDPVQIAGTLTIDEFEAKPTKYQSVKIESGSLNLAVVNSMDLDGTAVITFPNIRTSSGAVFTQTKLVPRKQTVNIFQNYSLRDFQLTTAGSATNNVNYNVSFIVNKTSDFRTIKSTDGIKGTFQLSTLMIKEFVGQLKPTTLDVERTAVSLDVKDLQNKFKFTQLNMRNPILELRLRPSAQVEFSIGGRIEARNSIGQKSVMNLNSRTMNKTVISITDSIITLNADSVSNFFKKFTRMPDSIIVYAAGVVNPNYKTITVKKGDDVSGNARFEFPLDFGLQNGEFTDSIKVDLTDDDRDQINDVNTLLATLKISNGLPAQVFFSGRLYDYSNKFIMNFPPKYNDQDTVVTISGAITDNQGNVTTKNEQTITVKTEKGDAQKLASAKFMRVKLIINTSRSNNEPVKFKVDDQIKINISGSTNYHVNSASGGKK